MSYLKIGKAVIQLSVYVDNPLAVASPQAMHEILNFSENLLNSCPDCKGKGEVRTGQCPYAEPCDKCDWVRKMLVVKIGK